MLRPRQAWMSSSLHMLKTAYIQAIAPLIERPAPGLVYLMLSSSFKHTPLAALSRPVAGTCKNTLITTLPGSVKAVRENLETLFQEGVVDHAIELIKGGSGKQTHRRLASIDRQSSSDSSQSHGHRHHHHHHHGGHVVPTPRSAAAVSHDPTASGAHADYLSVIVIDISIQFLPGTDNLHSPSYPSKMLSI